MDDKKNNPIITGKSNIYSNLIDKKAYDPSKLKDQKEMFGTKTKLIQSVELYGYKAANKIHRVATKGLIYFMLFNIIWLLHKYNTYWKTRRVRF